MTTTVRTGSKSLSDQLTNVPDVHPTDISIDGDTAVAFTEDVEKRFSSYGWQVLHVDDGDKWATLF